MAHNLHDLLPLPYTEEALAHVAERVRRVQDRLGAGSRSRTCRRYFAYRADAMPEWEFLARVAERADCGILLDVNNVFVERAQPRLRSASGTSPRSRPSACSRSTSPGTPSRARS